MSEGVCEGVSERDGTTNKREMTLPLSLLYALYHTIPHIHSLERENSGRLHSATLCCLSRLLAPYERKEVKTKKGRGADVYQHTRTYTHTLTQSHTHTHAHIYTHTHIDEKRRRGGAGAVRKSAHKVRN
jgi:hypothetical protein